MSGVILADTSVWIEFLRGQEPVYSAFLDFLRLGRILSVPWIFAELLQGAIDEHESAFILDFWKEIRKPDALILEKIWLDAGRFSRKAKLQTKGVGLIDAAIIQAASSLDGAVWTLDKKLYKTIPPALRFNM